MNLTMNKNVLCNNENELTADGLMLNKINFRAAVSPVLTLFCMLACSMGALQMLCRVI